MRTEYLGEVLKRGWALVGAIFAITLVATVSLAMAAPEDSGDERLVSIYDRGGERAIVTRAATVAQALDAAKISVDPADIVEPGLDTELVAKNYHINVYRARPVVVADGNARLRVMTAEQSPRQIAAAANLELYDEDITELERVDDVITDGGAGLKLNIDRATPFTFMLYGKKIAAHSQAATVGEMLAEKNVKLGPKDGASEPMNTPLVAGMTVSVWRNGVQTVTLEEEVKMPVREIQNADQPIGFRQVQTPGKPGEKLVTYELRMQDGKEVSRKMIQSVVTAKPREQVVIVGTKTSGNPLTESMGVNMFADSTGRVHRETYYDLPMSGVMGNCGGTYSVRADGVKVDQDGYVLVAAHLGNYPRCTLVETSVGMAKVYDTGSFTSHHPHGIDIATDWSNNDGR